VCRQRVEVHVAVVFSVDPLRTTRRAHFGRMTPFPPFPPHVDPSFSLLHALDRRANPSFPLRARVLSVQDGSVPISISKRVVDAASLAHRVLQGKPRTWATAGCTRCLPPKLQATGRAVRGVRHVASMARLLTAMGRNSNRRQVQE